MPQKSTRRVRRGTTTVRCLTCQREMTVWHCLVAAGKVKYCSRPCYWESLKGERPLEEKFWLHVEKTEACWRWNGATDRAGYGQLGIDGKTRRAHRVSWELHYGPIPGGQWVLHRCDTPPCVRPDHLFLGTSEDNSADMWAKGRGKTAHLPGEKHPSAALTNTQAAEIRDRYAAGGVTQTALAREYDVPMRVVHNVVHGRTYRH